MRYLCVLVPVVAITLLAAGGVGAQEQSVDDLLVAPSDLVGVVEPDPDLPARPALPDLPELAEEEHDATRLLLSGKPSERSIPPEVMDTSFEDHPLAVPVGAPETVQAR